MRLFCCTIYNRFVDSEDTPISETVSSSPLIKAGVDERFPVWSLGDVWMVAGFFLLSNFFFTVLTVLTLSGMPAFKAKTMTEMLGDIRIALLPQFAAYAVTFWFVYRMVARHYGVPFLEGIEWNWPSMRWFVYLVCGVVLAFAITAIQSAVPKPSEVPLDKFLKTTSGMWTMATFGTLLAPFADEVFFRGLLFPALVRKTSMTLSVGVTAFLFTLIHGGQLGWNWGPLLLLFTVGVILTLIRAWGRSVAASMLVHMSYNLTLFIFLYRGTHGFQSLEKVVR